MVKASIGVPRLQRIQATPASVASHRYRFANVLKVVALIRVSNDEPTYNIHYKNYNQPSSEVVKSAFIGWLQTFREDLYFV